jgi:hypothetical protein
LADSFGLINRDGVAEGCRFHRGWREFLFAAFGAIGLRDHLGYGVSGGYDAVERWHGEFGRAQEDQAHDDTKEDPQAKACATDPQAEEWAIVASPIRRPSAVF